MILIADSGSTKTDWRLIKNDSEVSKFESAGINPILQSSEEIEGKLKKVLSPEITKNVKKVYFYGAGCRKGKVTEKMKDVLKIFFLPDIEISVNSDLLAAVKATCQDKPGITCILGTGSNSCLFDGEEIVDNVPALGYVLGDKGAGSVLGRKLLTSFFKRNLPKDLDEKFKNKYNLKLENVIDAVYRKPFPNKYLASFTPFLSENSEHPFIYAIISKSFVEFADYNLVKYENYKKLPVNFVGSVAYYFQNILRDVLKQKEINVNKILQKPIEELTNFHKKIQ